MSILEICQWLEKTPLGVEIQQSVWWFPLLNVAHVLGMAVAAGTIAFVDLRLLGLGIKKAPISHITRNLLPWVWGGFVVMFISGSLLIASEAVMLYGNIAFRLKLCLLVLTGINVLVFHRTVYRNVSTWEMAPVVPFRARLAGGISLTCWLVLIALGRVVPYLE